MWLLARVCVRFFLLPLGTCGSYTLIGRVLATFGSATYAEYGVPSFLVDTGVELTYSLHSHCHCHQARCALDIPGFSLVNLWGIIDLNIDFERTFLISIVTLDSKCGEKL
ncbi:hypothetical protein L218DRAFT_717056 [Marasmius fiardii PR-910]|nr:hypothetical protein L218DRAFT_717056 [Marasmius fiardii PR-910]